MISLPNSLCSWVKASTRTNHFLFLKNACDRCGCRHVTSLSRDHKEQIVIIEKRGSHQNQWLQGSAYFLVDKTHVPDGQGVKNSCLEWLRRRIEVWIYVQRWTKTQWIQQTSFSFRPSDRARWSAAVWQSVVSQTNAMHCSYRNASICRGIYLISTIIENSRWRRMKSKQQQKQAEKEEEERQSMASAKNTLSKLALLLRACVS